MRFTNLWVPGIVLFCLAGCKEKLPGSSETRMPLQFDMEGLMTDKNVIQFGNVFFGDTPADTIRVYNPVTAKLRACEFSYDVGGLQILPRPRWLNPGDTGMVIVRLVTKELGQYGDVLKRVRWIGEDGMPGMSMAVTVHIKENFHKLSSSDRRDAPSVYIPEQKHDFGNVEGGRILTWKARIENHGKKELIIRNIKTSCGCTAVLPEKRVIAGGDGCWLDITFNTSGREGVQHKTVSLMSNDWRRPEMMLSFRAEIRSNKQ